MPTTTFFSVKDGWVSYADFDYNLARAGTGAFVNVDESILAVGQRNNSGLPQCHESFLSFDTSSIPDGATITSVVFSLYGMTAPFTTSFTTQARLQDWGTTLEAGDYVAGASLSGLTLLATFASSSFALEAYNDFTNVAFPANINKTGFTRFLINSDRHMNGNVPTDDGEIIEWYQEGEAGTSKDPKLVVTFTNPAMAPTHSFSAVRW